MPLNTQTAITIGGIHCWDEETSGKLGREGSVATRKILCAWTDRIALGGYLLGGYTVVNGVSAGALAQSYPDAEWLCADAVEFEGVAGNDGLTVGANGMIAYRYARLTVTYKQQEFNVGQEVGEENLDFGIDTQPISTAQPIFQWADNSRSLDALGQPIVRFGIIHFTKLVKSLPSLPIVAITNLIDHVNNATFLGATAGKLLYCGAKSTRRFTAGGIANWDVLHQFCYRSQDWRKYFRPGGAQGAAGWTTVQYVDGSQIYGSGDFTTLGISATSQ